MAKRTYRARAGAKASADKPMNLDYYLYRINRLRVKTEVDPEYEDMRAVGLLLIEGWISA
jgi:hypothetical protein